VHRFGDLESVVMDRLWSRGGSATVRDLVDELRREREIAYTTVMTTMDNLHRKGWLTREREGRAYRYRTMASREEYVARLMREALDRSDDVGGVFAHFVTQMSEQESRTLRDVLRRASRRRP